MATLLRRLHRQAVFWIAPQSVLVGASAAGYLVALAFTPVALRSAWVSLTIIPATTAAALGGLVPGLIVVGALAVSNALLLPWANVNVGAAVTGHGVLILVVLAVSWARTLVIRVRTQALTIASLREAEAKRAAQVTATLASVGAAATLEGALEALLRGGAALLSSTGALARMWDPETGRRLVEVVLRADGTLNIERPPGPLVPGSFGARLFAGEPPVVVPDYRAPALSTYPFLILAERDGIRAAVHVPIECAGRRIGNLSFRHSFPNAFGPTELAVAGMLATQAGAVIDRVRANEHRQATLDELTERERTISRQATRLQALNELAQAVGGMLDVDDLSCLVVEQVATLLNANAAAIHRYDSGTDQLYFVARWTRLKGTERAPAGEWSPENHAIGAVVRSKAPHVVADTAAADGAGVRGAAALGLRSVSGVPIVVDGAVWGTLGAGFASPGAVTDERHEYVAFLNAIAAHLAVAIRNAELIGRLQTALKDLHATQQQIVQQERLRALGEMASGVAHDFNNALSPVLGFSELLLLAPAALKDPAKVQHYLELIHAGAADAASVVRRLREFYRPRELHTDHRPVDVAQVIGQAIALTAPKWKDQAQAQGRTIVVEQEVQAVPPISGDEAAIREMLVNLIFNAVDAMPDGGMIALRTWLDERHGRALAAGRTLVLEVADTGTGMSEDVRRRCLEPFFSTKDAQGSGLGLSMVHGIVQRHQGTIEIESAPGKGTTFRLRFPVATQRAIDAAAAATATRGSDAGAPAAAVPAMAGAALVAGPSGEPHRFGLDAAGVAEIPDRSSASRGLTILVVDDEPLVRQVTAAFLVRDGHHVVDAASGDDALEQFGAGEFDLVVTDRAMPGMSGEQLAAAIKRESPATPVVLLTGFGELMRATGEAPCAVDAIAAKPATAAALRAAIDQALAGAPEADAEHALSAADGCKVRRPADSTLALV